MDRRRNRHTAAAALLVIVAMAGLTAGSVPLYDLFCRVTGYGGTPRVTTDAASGATGADVTVYFNADVGADLPWLFRPAQRSVTVRPGEERLAFYQAQNRSDRPVVGRAVFNVTPHKAGGYFNKVHCFCFEEQTLRPGERVDMPVSFFIDPAMLQDAGAGDLRQITLSYTFFVDREATARLRADAAASRPAS